jgi:hypothetical protein
MAFFDRCLHTWLDIQPAGTLPADLFSHTDCNRKNCCIFDGFDRCLQALNQTACQLPDTLLIPVTRGLGGALPVWWGCVAQQKHPHIWNHGQPHMSCRWMSLDGSKYCSCRQEYFMMLQTGPCHNRRKPCMVSLTCTCSMPPHSTEQETHSNMQTCANITRYTCTQL